MNYQNNIYLPDIVGKGYRDIWNYKGRYCAIKGSRASKKSKTTALWIIYNMMVYPLANTLVVRKIKDTLRDSCCADLIWAIKRLKVEQYWDYPDKPTSKLEITYKPTGQKILFRGLDDSLKITSITVENGYLCWCWVEEAYEIMSEEDFDKLDESIRGDVPEGYFKQIRLTFNPWNEHHWLKRRFFDNEDDQVLAVTVNYMCNEWLDEADKLVFERMKINNPRRYQVAGLGNWGIVEGVIYENWREEKFSMDVVRNLDSAFGLDFGYTNDPTAFFCGAIDTTNKKIYVFDEIYKKGLSNKAIYEEIQKKGYSKERITGDSAEPKSIDELIGYGLRIKGAIKGKDSINNGIQFIQDYEIIVHPRCVNFITEISNYTWDEDKFKNKINRPIDDFNHLMDAMRYAVERYIVNKKVTVVKKPIGL